MKTPAELAQDLIALAGQLHNATFEAAKLDEESVRAKSRYEVAYARAFLAADGSVDVRKQLAVLETETPKLDAEIAAQKLRACAERLRYIRTSLDVGRTLSATTRAEFAATSSDGGNF